VLIDVGAGARATLIEHHLGRGASVSNSVTDVICAAGARLSYVKLQDEADDGIHLATQGFHLGNQASAELLHLDLGSRLARNDLRVELAGDGATVSAHGLFFADGSRHLDNHTRVDHRAPHTVSRELYRGIADSKGRGVFNGKVIVHAGAGGTDAQLRNQNLLLSSGAEIDTKPELEIYADDVKCSHGATTGQLDATAIFYLRSRGIPAEDARRMLIASFAREIVGRLPAGAIEKYVLALLHGRLPAIGEVAGEP
jgi:Fe-S cluster assembly protein SufD